MKYNAKRYVTPVYFTVIYTIELGGDLDSVVMNMD